MIKAKVLVLDIETSGIVALVWGIGKQYLTRENVLEDWHILSFSAKWLNDPVSKMVYMETRNKNDLPLLKKLHSLFNEADIVITQNGKRFDEPRIKARMMLCGLKPYRPFKHHDTYQENRDKDFTSHGLGYFTDKFCKKYKKLPHKKFPGLSLWKECRNGNPQAWAEMRRYNNHDVLSTEEFYQNTLGWSTKRAPIAYEGNNERLCKYCGKYELTKQGYNKTAKKIYIQMQCQDCGKWQRGQEVK